ncbi:hypothetical protein DFH08DRAFT_812503 [Mycena albidolilacea]|uniref:Uncharacterized protein n=1 Tax=Mycena albidolilacea TaxID=1033008 RepID=A0AAD6ZTQ7_9AGAR|nr:hypothetical protein DFH08DRAFT_812503 [Mycena albidolilacea]
MDQFYDFKCTATAIEQWGGKMSGNNSLNSPDTIAATDIEVIVFVSLSEHRVSPPADIIGDGAAYQWRTFHQGDVGHNIPAETRIKFSKYVGPAGTLASYIGDHVVHCMDNSVAYLELRKDKSQLLLPAAQPDFQS